MLMSVPHTQGYNVHYKKNYILTEQDVLILHKRHCEDSQNSASASVKCDLSAKIYSRPMDE